MSLRWRLAIALGLVAALAAVAVAAIAYATAARQLREVTDEFLARRTNQLVRPAARAVATERLPPRLDREGEGPGALFRVDTVVQVLDENGDVVVTTGPVELPVETADERLAV